MAFRFPFATVFGRVRGGSTTLVATSGGRARSRWFACTWASATCGASGFFADSGCGG